MHTNTRNKIVFISVAKSSGFSKRNVADVIYHLIEFISASLCAGQPVTIHKLGCWRLKWRRGRRSAGRLGHPPGEVVVEPPTQYVQFKVSPVLSKRVRKTQPKATTITT